MIISMLHSIFVLRYICVVMLSILLDGSGSQLGHFLTALFKSEIMVVIHIANCAKSCKCVCVQFLIINCKT